MRLGPARLATLLSVLFAILAAGPAPAQELRQAVNALGAGGFSERIQAVGALARLGDAGGARALEALGKGGLYVRAADKTVLIGPEAGLGEGFRDAISGEPLAGIEPAAVEKVRLNNALRRAVAAALGELTLFNPDPKVRRGAAQAVFKSGDPSALETLGRAIARETDARIKTEMMEARAVAILKSDAPTSDKLAAVETLAGRGDRDALAHLRAVAGGPEGALKVAASDAAREIEQRLELWNVAQNVWYGVSLGSVLLLAAIGLAITFGVMGVINMAHGEMVMLGAYTTFVVQEIFRAHYPAYFDQSLFVAVVMAFVIAGAFGVALERGVIRFLYGRPLETLLATWGLSLVLQQLVRSVFGPSNREVGTPSWMSGTVELTSGLALTSNRIAIVCFAALVFIALTLVIRKTTFGLQMRAVTQNRAMANSVGIRSGWVDAMTFGLGSGIAGMAGVALSQIDNVSPNLGQSYIIDSFLVVVFGGVGNLWGTLVGALSLGILNKFLEPYAGAVLGKILILVAVILFIQKRPRGLFALKGRAAEG
jgi:urea transport system permease protein